MGEVWTSLLSLSGSKVAVVILAGYWNLSEALMVRVRGWSSALSQVWSHMR